MSVCHVSTSFQHVVSIGIYVFSMHLFVLSIVYVICILHIVYGIRIQYCVPQIEHFGGYPALRLLILLMFVLVPYCVF